MSDFAETVGPTVVELMDHMETTSVDGRIYVSVEDMLGFCHAGLADLSEIMQEHIELVQYGDESAVVGAERAHAMALIYALFDHTLHALEDREGLESLSPGDFV